MTMGGREGAAVPKSEKAAPGNEAPSRIASFASATALVFSASLAMAATLPGRSHGLGIITKPLLADFTSLSLTQYGQINMAATLLGSLLCLPCGWLIDRFGGRAVLAPVMLGLAAAVFAMSEATSVSLLAIALTLTRGVGQSMLSVVSIAMLSKRFRRDSGPAMGGFAVLMTILMAIGTVLLLSRVGAVGWRSAWREQAIVLLGLAPLAWLTAAPTRRGGQAKAKAVSDAAQANESSATLSAALQTSCFWAFALGISLFALISSGVSLFQQLILEERGLGEEVFQATLAIGLFAGLTANLVGGWAMRRFSPAGLQAVGLALLACSLASLPLLRTAAQAYAQSAVSGASGGLITVLFFSVWAPAFGAANVGRIQAAAQMMTVLASAAGPLIVAVGHERFGNYLPVLASLAGAAALLAVWSLFVSIPNAARGDWGPIDPSRPTP